MKMMKIILFCICVPTLFIAGWLKPPFPRTTSQSGFMLEFVIFLETVTVHRKMGPPPDLLGLGEI